MKIFVLDDDPIFEDIIRKDLVEGGHEVDSWKCIQGAKEKILAGNYDLLIIDIILPEKDNEPGIENRKGGIAILKSLKITIPATIFVSVAGYEENKEEIANLNLNQKLKNIQTYFRKPYFVQDFLNTVKSIENAIRES